MSMFPQQPGPGRARRRAVQLAFVLFALFVLAACSSVQVRDASRDTGASRARPSVEACIDAARFAYAALLSAQPGSGDAQLLRDDYNEAVDCAATKLLVDAAPMPASGLRMGRMEVRMPEGRAPARWITANRLHAKGLHNDHRREGIGVALVAEADGASAPDADSVEALRLPRFAPATAILRFPGETADEVLHADAAVLDVLDPYASESVTVGRSIAPLAADFTAPHALWLARSRLKRQGDRALVRRDADLKAPQVYAMQSFDPQRRVVVLLHGLASSPEAWANVANDILGDEQLRRRYQLWEVFYPTNLPIAENVRAIREALQAALASVDPQGETAASRQMTLVGHSMGGVISRLLVVESGDALWRALLGGPVDAAQRQRLALLQPYLDLSPMPQVDRIILLAAPHRGSPTASGWLGRMASRLVGLPETALRTVAAAADAIQGDAPWRAQDLRRRQMDSVEALSDQGRYLRTTATLQIAHDVAYHSIIGRKDPKVPLESSSDGLVPYSSSHLEGAMSELIVTSGHGVQQTPEAILEVRRILREAADGTPPRHPARKPRLPIEADARLLGSIHDGTR